MRESDLVEQIVQQTLKMAVRMGNESEYSSTDGNAFNIFDTPTLIFTSLKEHLKDDPNLRIITGPNDLRKQILSIQSSSRPSPTFVEFFESAAWRQMASSRIASDIFLNDLKVLILHLMGKFNSVNCEKLLTLLLDFLNESSLESLSLHVGYPKQPVTRMQDYACQALKIDPKDQEKLRNTMESMSPAQVAELLEGWRNEMTSYLAKLNVYIESTELSSVQKSSLTKNRAAVSKLIEQLNGKIATKKQLAQTQNTDKDDFIAAMKSANAQTAVPLNGQQKDSPLSYYEMMYESTPEAVRVHVIAKYREAKNGLSNGHKI
ncbi:hypothetical protein WR25_13944 [Diploscapter pachys]|uniref:Uncharacterized protein n=1 Tax=Diploscapter pachys TaxID=2018661 RepID=A0A2A2L5R0_9BILA|nr:hypothetical protein WR25_13944 [Diploscapter pachys]